MHGKAKRRRLNAAMLCADASGLQWTIDRYSEGQTTMAQGGETAAYKVWLTWDDDGGRLHTQQTARLRTDCATVDHAARALVEEGATVVVAGSDMMVLRSRLASLGVG